MAKARAEGDASLANALYNELVRVQELNRQDSILQAEREYAAGRDAVADKQWQDAFDYQQAQDAQAYQQWLQQMAYQKEQDALAQQNWLKQFEYQKEAANYEALLEEAAAAKKKAEAEYAALLKEAETAQKTADVNYNALLKEYEKLQSGGKTENDALLALLLSQKLSGTGGGSSNGSGGGGSSSGGGFSGGSSSIVQNKPVNQTPTYQPADEPEDAYASPAPAPATPVTTNKYTGTNFMQDAIDAAMQGDRETAEAALAARAEKMASSEYKGTGGGTSMEEAWAYIEELLAESGEGETPVVDAPVVQTPVKEPVRDTDGRAYNNGTLTRDQIAEMQNYYEVDADGLWGKNSSAAAGGQTAEQAWEEYAQMMGYTDEPENLTTTNRHGEGWVQVNGNRMTWVELENKVDNGEVDEVINEKKGTVTYIKKSK